MAGLVKLRRGDRQGTERQVRAGHVMKGDHWLSIRYVGFLREVDVPIQLDGVSPQLLRQPRSHGMFRSQAKFTASVS